jgi:hypothetical protein
VLVLVLVQVLAVLWGRQRQGIQAQELFQATAALAMC